MFDVCARKLTDEMKSLSASLCFTLALRTGSWVSVAIAAMMHLSASCQLVRGQHSDDSSCVGGVTTTSKDRTALALRGFG